MWKGKFYFGKSCQRQIKADAYIWYKLDQEYAAVAWAPHTRCDVVERLEAVQR